MDNPVYVLGYILDCKLDVDSSKPTGNELIFLNDYTAVAIQERKRVSFFAYR